MRAEERVRELRRRFGDRFSDDPAVAALYLRDATFLEARGRVLGVVYPLEEGEVAWLVRWAAEAGTPLYPQGSATSISGNAAVMAPGVVVSFEKMAGVEVRPADGIAVVEPGVRLEELNIQLERHGLFFPVDPGSYRAATVGGAIANGAGGMRGARYGSMRDWVLGLRVVTGRGEAMWVGCMTLKCRAGYDLVRLFVGSEGTLGLVTKAVLKLAPVPESAAAVAAQYDEVETLVEDVVRVRASRIWPLFAEFVDDVTAEAIGLGRRHVLFLGVDLPQGSEARALERLRSLVRGKVTAEAAGWREAMQLLEPRRRLFYGQIEASRRDGGVLVIEDVAVPISRMPAAVRGLKAIAGRLGLPLLLGGHVGDGNLHPATWYRRGEGEGKVEAFLREMGRLVKELEGTISAEHGIGLLKKDLLKEEADPTALAYMAQLKRLFDPHNILNPGKIVDL